MRLLDLYCGPGGASVGYARAGFDVVGVDIEPQPDYPYPFIQGDALDYLTEHGHGYDAIHASPPCTEHTTLVHRKDDSTGTRDLLQRTLDALAPYPFHVVENVMGAAMPTALVLCGTMFGLRVYRHRRFAIGPGMFLIGPPPHPPHRVPAARKQRQAAWDAGHNLTVTGEETKAGRRHHDKFLRAMGIDWIEHDGINLTIPPAYTEFIGSQLIEAMDP